MRKKHKFYCRKNKKLEGEIHGKVKEKDRKTSKETQQVIWQLTLGI